MIKVTVIKDKDRYKGFSLNGHALYADAGKDVVCAAVSMLAINTVNSIETLAGIDQDVETDKDKGSLVVRFKEELSDRAEVLMDAFVLGITSTQKTYGDKYVTYKEIQDT